MSLPHRFGLVLVIASLAFGAACSGGDGGNGSDDGGVEDGAEDGVDGDDAAEAGDDAAGETEAEATLCTPGTSECVDALNARTCDADGTAWIDVPCDTASGEACRGDGVCTNLSEACFAASATGSNEACDFWATQTINSQLMEGALPVTLFGFEISNRQGVAATVQVLGPAGVLEEVTVPQDETAVVTLPWGEGLRSPTGSVLAAGAAYRIVSDVPVTAVQFNPLEYYGGTMETNSFSNDASLLLPRHVLTGNYMIASRPTFMMRRADPIGGDTFTGMAGFLAVVGVEDDTQVEVTFTAQTQASATGSDIEAYAPGDTGTFRLDRFDVLQILTEVPATCTPTVEVPDPYNPGGRLGYCDLGPTFDLTGSVVSADKPVAVFGGHDCSFVPFDRGMCDHLEEQLPPMEAWGERVVAARAHAISDEPTVWRVISREDGNEISFQPDVWAPQTLDRGAYHEFETTADFVIEGTAPLLAVRFLAGQGSTLDSIGDPSMSIAVPVAQYRMEYGFLAPEAFRDDTATGRRGESWLDVMAPTGTEVLLDGAAVAGLAPIGTLGFAVARVAIVGGPHVISAAAPLGISVYGFGNFVSYAVPGGMNADPISPLP